jgi:hypothetical protein
MEYLKILKNPNFTPHNFVLANCDTDSIAFRKHDHSAFTEEEIDQLIEDINSIMPERIVWDDDGTFERFIVIKAKNYLTDDGKKIKIKGSALKATLKEPALRTFIREVLELLRTDKQDEMLSLYNTYAERIMKVTADNIKDWVAKKTVTKALMTSKRANETRPFAALKGKAFSEGDKVFLFVKEVQNWGKPKIEEPIYCLLEDFTGQYCKRTLLSKLYDTLKVFSTIVDVKQFPNYSLVKNKKLMGL